MSQTITPTPVLPVRGPAGFHQFSALFRPAETSARVSSSPITNTPTAAARIAAAAGPLGFGFSAIIFFPLPDRRGLVEEGAEHLPLPGWGRSCWGGPRPPPPRRPRRRPR